VITALGLPVLGYGVLFSWILAIDGALLILAGTFGWALEPSTEPAPQVVPSAEQEQASGHGGHEVGAS
jgi:hypothetical protein